MPSSHQNKIKSRSRIKAENTMQDLPSSSSTSSSSKDYYSGHSSVEEASENENSSSSNTNNLSGSFSNKKRVSQDKSERTLECILDRRSLNGIVKYRVKWIGLDRCTWETEDELRDHKTDIKEFLKKREEEIAKRRRIGMNRRKISLLKKKEAKKRGKFIYDEEEESDNIEDILDIDEDGYYLVKWKNLGNNSLTWESYDTIRNSQLLKKFEKKRKLNQSQKDRSPNDSKERSENNSQESSDHKSEHKKLKRRSKHKSGTHSEHRSKEKAKDSKERSKDSKEKLKCTSKERSKDSKEKSEITSKSDSAPTPISPILKRNVLFELDFETN